MVGRVQFFGPPYYEVEDETADLNGFNSNLKPSIRHLVYVKRERNFLNMPTVTMREMLEAGVHFGHQTHHWHPRMKPYVFGARNGIYIINLQVTVDQAKKACDYVKTITSEGKKILFVGTKKQAKSIIENEAKRAGMPYVTDRWLGGMLTNYQTVKASIERLKKLEALKESEEWGELVKKEQSMLDKELSRLTKSLGGIKDMKKLPAAVFIVDVIKEHIAIKEANKLKIPTVAVVDTNSDPSGVDYVIPGNDDAIRSVGLFAKLIADSCIEGENLFQEKLRAKALPQVEEKEEGDKRVSKFEGDIDLQGIDEADIAAMEVDPEAEPETEESKTKH